MEHSAIELFCGIGGFRQACDLLGITTVWANDISTKACTVYRDNFESDLLVEGDIQQKKPLIPRHDLLTAGFPCQPFSSAGQKKGIHDPRGTLFYHIIDILKDNKPQFFVLENVKRILSMQDGSHFATILEELSQLDYAIEWRVLNAAHLGLAQHRERIFIIGTLVQSTPIIPSVKLANDNDLEPVLQKKYDLLMNYQQWKNISQHTKKFPLWGLAFRGKFFSSSLTYFSESKPSRRLRDILEQECDDFFDYTEETRERIKQSRYVDKYVNGVQILYNQGGGARMGYTIFGVNGIASTLTASTSRHYERYAIDNRYRRLTNVEYARLQGFPEQHCRAVSVYDQYALYGNAVPPPMVQWVIEKLLAKGKTYFQEPQHRQLLLLEGS
ncbi:MAG: DNA cytosine methyltransferase [Deltaproteobacteria bacterium]|nr:DNA cytosine methyltransferase [Deltaproteobacteria bacterium]